MSDSLGPEHYYLSNFLTALSWIEERYGDLLSAEEHAFICGFRHLPLASQALLVRLVMRKGPHFRRSVLKYPEIGDIAIAAEALLKHGWLHDDQPLDATQLFALLRRGELLTLLPDAPSSTRKADLFEALSAKISQPARFSELAGFLNEPLYTLMVGPLCERLRLMFFGNLSQQWSEFVLADLGIFRYEQVPIAAQARGFSQRADIDDYLHLRACREQLEAGASVNSVLEQLGPVRSDNPWILNRHAKLLFLLARQAERDGELHSAVTLYQRSHYPGARQRRIRLLDRLESWDSAWDLAQVALASPESDAEQQLLERLLARLARQLDQPAPAPRPRCEPERIDLTLANTGSVEWAVREHLHTEQAPVHYVENTLINSLFGLLCWEAIFTPLPGAFFHPFHSGPVDLLSADFHQRRAQQFTRCLARLDDGSHAQHIRAIYQAKQGIQSPFVAWDWLPAELLDQALLCLPAEHLKAWFQRLLQDLRNNRAGMPDLIQFWPQERRYRMIEVKGPGDRLQDNQKRWIEFCTRHNMPVQVCHVRWSEA